MRGSRFVGAWRFCFLVAGLTASAARAEDGLDALQERAIKAAVQKVAPSVVQIETSGGSDVLSFQSNFLGVAEARKGLGPTTGLVVAPDGYIISSAFNFASKPSAIFVQVPGRKDRFVAEVVATDHARMLTLLKIKATGLPVPTASPKKDFKVGQWSIALGRTWASAEGPPSVSVGVISALNRIWGKAVQTDAKVSPVNYGGPLVDILGRVQGVLVPASPQEEGATAGLEWYDSGIGFAVPFEDVLAVLPRLQKGQDLHPGKLGVVPRGRDMYGEAAVVGSVSPGSAAAQAGIRGGDTIIEMDGKPVTRQAELMHILGNKYEGDTVTVKVRRGKEEHTFKELRLAGLLQAYADPFLGVLPVRDDPEPGVEVRYVFPKSPAEAAGLKAGDRIMSLGDAKETPKAFTGRDQLLVILNGLVPRTEVKLEVRRKKAKDKELETLTLKLETLGEEIPVELPGPASAKKAMERPKPAAAGVRPPPPPPRVADKPELGFLQRTNAAGDRHYWVYVPENYDPNVAHALVVWLHPAKRGAEKDAREFKDVWQDFCRDYHIILVGPQAQNESGWLFSEADFVQEATREVMRTYSVDRQRVVAHGMGSGGNLAFYVGLQARDLFRGVAAVGGALAGKAPDNVPNQRLAFFIAAGDKDPLAPAVKQSRDKLAEKRFPVAYRVMGDRGQDYLDADPKALQELVRWVESLDRM